MLFRQLFAQEGEPKMTLTNDAKLQEINAQTLKTWLDKQDILLIDVREPGEYAAEHIAQAKLLPLSKFAPNQVNPQPGQKVVLYCQSSNRSGKVARQLLDQGFTNISHLQGGLPTWKAAGYPVEKNPKAPISIFRQVQIVAGSLVVIGTVLGVFVSPWFLLLSGFVGSGLVFAGITNTCALGMLLAKLPYNQQIK